MVKVIFFLGFYLVAISCDDRQRKEPLDVSPKELKGSIPFKNGPNQPDNLQYLNEKIKAMEKVIKDKKNRVMKNLRFPNFRMR